MDERPKADLPYGHFGHAEYFLENSTWRFGRSIDDSEFFVQLGAPNVVVLGDSSDHPKSKPHRHESTSKHHTHDTKALAKSYPEFRAVKPLLPPLLRVSEAVQHAVSRHEPTKGNLVAYAEIWSAQQHGPIPVAAIAASERGSVLRLMQIQTFKQGWTDAPVPYLSVPTLSGEESTWRDVEEPIQQVCFSQKAHRSSPLLAIRLLTAIKIFQPWHRKTSQDRGLGLDLLFNLSIHETGGYTQIDMTFNPWFRQQFGVVDCNGNWAVLEFQSRQMRKITRSWRGSIHSSRTQRSNLPEDGWSRVVWVQNVETIVICTRQQLTLFNIAGEDAMALKQLHFGSAGSMICILDLLVLPDHMETLCLLTSTHVVVMDVSDQSNGLFTRFQTTVRHFRSPDDFSLRLTCWSEDDTNVNLLVHGSRPDPTSLYRLSVGETGTVIAKHPVELPLAECSRVTKAALAEVHVQSVKLVKSQQSANKALENRDHLANYTRFFMVTVLHTDHTMTETLFCRRLRDLPHDQLEPPSWTGKVSMAKKVRSSLVGNENLFIVHDESDVVSEQNRAEPAARKRRRPIPLPASQQTVGLELVAEQLGTTMGNTQSIDNLAAQFKKILTSRAPESLPFVPTLCNLLQGQLIISNVHEASATLEETLLHQDGLDDDDQMQDPSDPNSGLEIASICIPEITSLKVELLNNTVASAYDHLVSGWISSLPASISGWVRLAKVSIARGIAAELMLASRKIQPKEKQESRKTQQFQDPDVQSKTYSWDLPVRTFGNISGSSSVRATPDAFALPTPSSTGTSSVNATGSDFSSSRAFNLSRLERYATFEKPAPSALPRSLRNVLAHWKLGDDPETYDWVSQSRELAQQNELEDEEMTEKEQKRMERRAEKHIQRQRREAAASQARQLAGTQATEIFSTSQPPALKVESQPFGAMVGSSQTQAQSQGLPSASQIVPGRFGGRPPKKKRKQGF